MRARLAIAVSGVSVEYREIALRNKPQAMLAISPKGTVPIWQFFHSFASSRPSIKHGLPRVIMGACKSGWMRSRCRSCSLAL
ncbi:MAG TPA: glutathione S-transferase N-terminal domain-containing protein [Spongiibacteraceae bacterium]|nr:glutathione S-transferase N-terminal domain-containing protein [Spongiibacteraceae bacterium]